VNIIFWGTPQYSVNSLEYIYKKHNILSVVTQPDRRRGRGKNSNFSPIKIKSLELGIPIIQPTNIKLENDIQEQIISLNADLFVVVAFGQILPTKILNAPLYGCWNAHASILPRWRGAAPIQRSILSGDKETGVGIMYMEEGLDTGPVLLQKNININPNDNSDIIGNKLSIISANLLLDSIELIESAGIGNKLKRLEKLNLNYQSNSNSEITYAKMISREEYHLKWNNNSNIIHRHIMGLNPNTYSYCNNKRIKILETDINLSNNLLKVYKNKINSFTKLNNGQIIDVTSNEGIIVKTNDGIIVIKKAQLPGKNISMKNILKQQFEIYIGSTFL
tara:strand:+ start:21855 stop:22856 length:1002 start_codon:yes stop_codon:yes gene_type:complete